MGWEAINPFSGNLTDTLGQYLTGVTSIDDIKNQTWRKTLNNLLYIYKSKGTKNSVRALLNTYGYPPDVLEFQEFGGSTEESNPRIFVNTPPSGSGIDLSLDTSTDVPDVTFALPSIRSILLDLNNALTPLVSCFTTSSFLDIIFFKSILTSFISIPCFEYWSSN